MTHKATLLDAKTDIYRCIMCSYADGGLNNSGSKRFLASALTIIQGNEVDKKKTDLVKKQIKKSQEKGKDIEKAREDILTIATII